MSATLRGLLRDGLHVLALSAFAVAGPLFDLLSRHATFFVAHRAEPGDILLIAVLLCGFVPACLLALELAAALLGAPVRAGTHAVVVAVLCAASVLPVLNRIPGAPGAVLLIAAVLLGAAAAAVYRRSRLTGTFVTALSPAVVVFPALFLLRAPIVQLLRPPAQPAPAPVEMARPAPVVVVVFDALPLTSLMNERHEMDEVRYPHFAALARDADWYRGATAVSDFTASAVPALLTGNYPGKAGKARLPAFAKYPHNLFTFLAGTHDLRVFETFTYLCPRKLCGGGRPRGRVTALATDVGVLYLHLLLPPDLRARLPDIQEKWAGFIQPAPRKNRLPPAVRAGRKRRDRAGQFEEFLASIRPSTRPTLHFLHVLLPHAPHEYLPSGTRYLAGSAVAPPAPGLRWRDETAATAAFQRHLLQVGFVDTLVGTLVARLKDADLYDRALIVVTADHGASFEPGKPYRIASPRNSYDVLPVPLLIKAPHQERGTISDRNVELIDVLPTIADILGARLDWRIDGRSMRDPSVAERRQKVVYPLGGRRALALEHPLTGIDASLQRKRALFGSDETIDGLFKVGRSRFLVGRGLGELAVAADGRLRVELDGPERWDAVDPESGFVPALVTGRLFAEEAVEADLELAVAVNGIVRAVTKAFRDAGDRPVFAAMVPETAFRPGRNDVEVLRISGVGDGVRLGRLEKVVRRI
jgi:hypothetical protein